MDLTKAVVLVTGASSGIGAATARAASRAGARLVLLARREDRLRELAAELGEALPISCDVTDHTEVEAAVRAAIDTYGRIDVLVNNAGQGLQATIEELDPADLRAVFELNVVAALHTMQAVLPAMRAQGSGAVVNISSGITFSDLPGSAGYSASKAALEKLTSIARAELAEAGIAVSLMIPWITSTEFSTSVRGDVAGAQELEAGSGFKPDTPEHVADAILNLIRSGASRADLVPVEAGGTPDVMTWSPEQLDRIGRAQELEIAVRRGDKSLRPWTPIWVVAVGGAVYVRTWYRRSTGWFGHAVRSEQARVRVPGMAADVRIEDVGIGPPGLRTAIDDAYRDKYGGGSTGGMVGDEAAATTLRLLRMSQPAS